MRAVMVDVPERMLEERRLTGADRFDEMWEGVLHMVPPPSGDHQRLGTKLVRVLGERADKRGLESSYETGLFAGDDNYRQPDLLFTRPEQVSRRGAEGAELVVEIRSANDESYEKLLFYAAVGVREVLIVHPDERRAELFTTQGEAMQVATAAADGSVRSEVLGVAFRTIAGPRLELTWDGGRVEV